MKLVDELRRTPDGFEHTVILGFNPGLSLGADRASTHMSTSILMQRPWRHAFERAQVHSGDGVA
jgi:hypothetical protein